MRKFWLLSWSFLLIVGCAVKSARPDTTGVKIETNVSVFIEPEAKGAFLQAEKEFQSKNYEKAIVKYQGIRNRWPSSKAAELSHYRVASVYYMEGEYSKAALEFETFSRKYPLSSFTFDVQYNLAASQYQLGQYDKVRATLDRVKKDDIKKQGAKRTITFYQLVALNAAAQSDHKRATLAYSHQLALVADPNAQKSLESKIDTQIQNINDPRELKEISEIAPELYARNRAAQKQLQLSGAQRVESTGSDLVTELRSPLPPMELGAGSKGSRNHIGVILPLKGKFAAYGRKALEGILLASKMFQSGTAETFTLSIEDSGSTPAMAQAALESLVQDKDVMAVIGPLNFKEGLAVAEKAQSLGVVNISLASKAGVSEQGPYIFQNALTPKVQLENLVRFSVADKGLKRFAIIAPGNSFGRDMAQEFMEQVENRGGKVVGIEFYTPNETDFQDPVRSIVGLRDLRMRKIESTALQDYLREQKAKTGREPKSKLKPIIDFDAVFLPDSPKTISAIAANLAFFDVSEVALLGITEWNSEQLYKRGGRFVERAIFPGVMNPVTRSSGQRDFMRSYQESFGVAPDLLAAQGFEAMQMVGLALQKSQSSNRADLARQIGSLQNLEAPIGMTAFDKNRIASRNIPLYMLDKFGNFVEQ
ncbi:outer membrane protein assembly factor BamD [bacterium]|nr:outer membrane protein assembly factor BamD [bacterium]